MQESNNLQDLLRSLGVRPGLRQEEAAQKTKKRTRIESLVPGYEKINQYGACYLVSKEHSDKTKHGIVSLDHPLRQTGMLEPLVGLQRDELLFIDTETTGLAGGTGTLAFMVGLGYFKGESFQVDQYFLRSPDEEKAMLSEISAVVEDHSTLVSYNGKSFDIPLVNTRYLINQMQTPLPGMAHIDLLHYARRLWRNRLASRSLSTVEQEILNFFRTAEDVPGWMVPELYYQFVRGENPEGIVPVFYHNLADILSLAALLLFIADVMHSPLSHQELPGLDLIAIARLYAERGNIDSAIVIYDESKNATLSEEWYLEALNQQAALHKKKGDYKNAVQNWEKAASGGSLLACEELAKFHEHQARDYSAAIHWVNKANEWIDALPDNSYSTRQYRQAYQHRLERLLRKWSEAQKRGI